MTSDPPSRIPPRGQPHDTKAARNELSSKNKVEKVREVDADETRKRKFKSFLDDEKAAKGKDAPKPSLFDLSSQNGSQKPLNTPPGPAGASSLEGLAAQPLPRSTKKDSSQTRPSDPLPRSDKFYDEAEVLPDQPPSERELKKAHVSYEGKKVEVTGHAGKGHKPHGKAKKGEEEELMAGMPIPVPPQGKPVGEAKEEKRSKWEREQGFDSGVKNVSPRIAASKDQSRFDREEEEEEMPLPPVHVEKKREDRSDKRDSKIAEIAAASHLPASVQPATVAAVERAVPYLHPTVVALFFQMVGQIYVMAGNGISRTELLLNNPSFAGSRFFGSTITIEKYATAPDSLNIRLTGSEQAVLSFRQNAASLMSAFQNGNFTFKVNRLDAEYTLERPVYRRKDKGKEKGDTGSGLGERRE